MDTYFNFDTLIQGFIIVFFLVLGCLIFFTDHLEKQVSVTKTQNTQDSTDSANPEESNRDSEESISSLNERLSGVLFDSLSLILGLTKLNTLDGNILKASKSLMYLLVISVLIFVMGIFAKTSADYWMNKGNFYHLGNKIGWAKNSEINETSDTLRAKAFVNVYSQDIKNAEKVSISDRDRHYYFIKHEILHDSANSSYKESLQNTISIIDYSQVFALSFFILYVFSWLNLISIQARSIIDRDRNVKVVFDNWFAYIRAVYIILVCICLVLIADSLFCYFWRISISSLVGIDHWDRIFWTYVAINGIPILSWIYLWLRSRQKNQRVNLIHSPNLTYRDLFIKHYFTIIFLFVGLIGYHTASVTWKKAESTKDRKVYGMYKNIDSEFSIRHKKEIHEIFHLNDVEKADTTKVNTKKLN